jgi:hypothetical protein
MSIVSGFRQALLARTEIECPATQRAVDLVIAQVSCSDPSTVDRARFFEWLTRMSRDELCDLVLVAWGHAPLKLATGRTRDQWLDAINAEYRAEQTTTSMPTWDGGGMICEEG